MSKIDEDIFRYNMYYGISGHSLGAHICGFAGRAFTNATDQYIARITGLDPARPCFNQGQSLDGLSRGDAAFVDIIHSNAGALGKKTTIGDVDFWPNGWVSRNINHHRFNIQYTHRSYFIFLFLLTALVCHDHIDIQSPT